MSKVVVVGASDLGIAVARRAIDPVIVEQDPERVQMLGKLMPGVRVVQGVGTDRKILVRAGILEAELLVAATESDAFNVLVVETGKKLKVPRILAWAESPVTQQHLRALGVERVISLLDEGVRSLANSLAPNTPVTSHLTLADRSPGCGKRIADLGLPAGVLIAAIERQDRLLTPDPDVVLASGDQLTLITKGPVEHAVRLRLTGGAGAFLPFERMLEVPPCQTVGRLATALSVPVEILPGEGKERWVRLLKGAEDPSTLVVVEPDWSFFRPHPPSSVMQALREAPAPLLIPRRYPFKRIVAIVGASLASENSAMAAVGLAEQYGGEVVLVVDTGAEEARVLESVARAVRVAESIRIRVDPVLVSGIVAAEVVEQVRNPRTSLLVMNWPPRSIPRALGEKILREAEPSVLVMKAAGVRPGALADD